MPAQRNGALFWWVVRWLALDIHIRALPPGLQATLHLVGPSPAVFHRSFSLLVERSTLTRVLGFRATLLCRARRPLMPLPLNEPRLHICHAVDNQLRHTIVEDAVLLPNIVVRQQISQLSFTV